MMASRSRHDKGKVPTIHEEDIGTEEGELVEQDPQRPEAFVRRRWFQWFTQETANRTPIEQKFFTPGSKKGVPNFRSHLMELAVEAFLKEKDNPNTRPWETSVSEMSQRLARFLEEVPLKWGQMYEEWLKSKEFKEWTEEAIRVKGENILFAYQEQQ
ncbi:hypothetical protein R1sor_024873 [Riccia sorocarpa]|uniref:Retrotransposon gag domain-containing protein n=1 Tax=Riccia sorocarpa TaxID=122646 RepID=A0ABD3GRP1_9MARC